MICESTIFQWENTVLFIPRHLFVIYYDQNFGTFQIKVVKNINTTFALLEIKIKKYIKKAHLLPFQMFRSNIMHWVDTSSIF